MTSTAGTGTETEELVDASTGDAHASPVLWVRGVSKRFGPVQANDDITIEFHAGEIHALLGENGSGKSTLLSVASGSLAPDSGTVDIAGERLPSASPRAAMRLGLGMAYQHLTAVAGLTVAENLFLGAPEHIRPGYSPDVRMGDREARPATSSTSGRSPDRDLVGRPAPDAGGGVGTAPRPKVLLLDEPTTALGHADVQRLHALIRISPRRGWASSTSATGCPRCSTSPTA